MCAFYAATVGLSTKEGMSRATAMESGQPLATLGSGVLTKIDGSKVIVNEGGSMIKVPDGDISTISVTGGSTASIAGGDVSIKMKSSRTIIDKVRNRVGVPDRDVSAITVRGSSTVSIPRGDASIKMKSISGGMGNNNF